MKTIKFQTMLFNKHFQLEILDKLAFLYPELKSLKWEKEVLSISIPTDNNGSKIKKQVEGLIKEYESVARFRRSDPTSSASGSPSNPHLLNSVKNKFNKITEQANAVRNSSSISLTPSFVRTYLNNAISELIAEVFEEEFDISNSDFTVPNLLTTTNAIREGYFKNSSQYVYMISEYEKSSHEISDYHKTATNDRSNLEEIKSFFHTSDWLLSPAVCLHLYPKLEGQRIHLNSHGYCAINMVGNAYRDEGRRENQLERLREFKVREIVFFGTANKLSALQQQIEEVSEILLGTLGILGKTEYSNDIFFGNQATQKLVSQLVSHDKLEFKSNAEKPFSIASMNQHHKKFTNEYDILNENGQPLESMCVAFGIDRISLSVENNLK